MNVLDSSRCGDSSHGGGKSTYAQIRDLESVRREFEADINMEATILHADLDAFYASVEQLLDPTLKGLPIAVGGGVVLAASYEAKAFGVQSGMSGRHARQLCPQLTFVSGHFKEYQRLGDAAIKIIG